MGIYITSGFTKAYVTFGLVLAAI